MERPGGTAEGEGILCSGPGVLPVARPLNWKARVNEALADDDVAGLRSSVDCGRPWWCDQWVQPAPRRFRLLFSLRNAGRPAKSHAPDPKNQ